MFSLLKMLSLENFNINNHIGKNMVVLRIVCTHMAEMGLCMSSVLVGTGCYSQIEGFHRPRTQWRSLTGKGICECKGDDGEIACTYTTG